MKSKKYQITIDPTSQTTKPPQRQRGKITNNLTQRVTVDLDQFIQLISPPISYTWSGAIFNGKPSTGNWVSQSVFGLDFDKGVISIEQVYERLNSFGIKPNLWYKTLSSSSSLIKFRVVLFLDKEITCGLIHEHISKGLLSCFPEADNSCGDKGRYFFSGTEVTLTSYSPCSTRTLFDLASTHLCAKDSFRTRSIPVSSINSMYPVSAPERELLYNTYRNYHFGATTRSRKSIPPPTTIEGVQKVKLDFSKTERNIRIFREFISGTWLTHMELFGLARNLLYVNGGPKLMKKTMNKYNKQGLTHYTDNNFAILPYLKKVHYPPQPIKDFSHYPEDAELHDLISESKDIRGHIKILEPIEKIPLDQAYQKFKTEFERVLHQERNDSIYLFRVPTAIGKTEMITGVNATICTPTNDLKNEIGERMKVEYTCTPDPIVFENHSLNNQLNYYYSIGLPNKSMEVLYSVIAPKNRDNYSERDIQEATNHINQIQKSYTTTSTLVTTHQRGLHSVFHHNTLIFDEDPLKSLISIQSVKVSDLFSINMGIKNVELDYVVKYLSNIPVLEITPTPTFNLDLDKIIKEVSMIPQKEPKSNLFDFFTSTFFVRDTHNPDIVHYVVKRDLPSNKKVIILSATAPVELYRKLYGERLQVIDISDVQQQGKIIQYTSKSYSRNSLNKQHEDLSKFIGDTPVITFKSYRDQFSNPSEMWFGNCSGYDTLKGQDLAVVGTPHINNVSYLLTAKVMGIDFNTSDTTMSYQKIEYNGFQFKFNCYNHPDLRMIQFGHIESDLIQAVGRARTLRTDATVSLYSNFPLRISTEFRY